MPGVTSENGGHVSLVFDQDVTMAENSDLTLTLLSPIENGVRRVTEVAASLQVCKASKWLGPIIKIAADPTDITLGGDLKPDSANKHGQEEGENKEGMLVCLAHLHKLSDKRMAELGLHKISVTGIWHVLRMWNYQENAYDMKALQSWFNMWYAASLPPAEKLDMDTARNLALPCQIFDHAVGFARVTKYLAFNNVGHFRDRQPKGIKVKLGHLAPYDFVGPTNHARTGLKQTLHKFTWKKAGNMLRFDTDKCNCWDGTIGRYLGALVKVDAFPVEDAVNRSSIREILDRLRKFKVDRPSRSCNRCQLVDWLGVVYEAVATTEKYYDGLCLDCMNRSKPNGHYDDAEYLSQNESLKDRWDHRCRIKHEQATWYVSWLGRDDTRQKLLKGATGGYRPNKDE